MVAGGFNLKLLSFWSSWHVTVQILLYLTCKPTSNGNRSNSPPHNSIHKPFPFSQFLKLIHLREVYWVKRCRQTYSSFHLFYCLFPCFSLPPSPLWSSILSLFQLVYIILWLLFYSLASSVFFFILGRSWNIISWLFNSSLSSHLSSPLIQPSLPNLPFCALLLALSPSCFLW